MTTNIALGSIPVVLSPYAPRGSVLKIGEPIRTPWGIQSVSCVVMHPIDWAERDTQPGTLERLRAGLAYILGQTSRRLDALEARL